MHCVDVFHQWLAYLSLDMRSFSRAQHAEGASRIVRHERVIGEAIRVRRLRPYEDDNGPPPVPTMIQSPQRKPNADGCEAALEAA